MNPHGRRGLCLRPVPGSSGPRVALCPIFVDSAIQEVPSLWTHVSSVPPPPLPPGQDHEVRAGHSFCTPSNLIAAHLAHPTTPEHIQPSEVKERSFDSFQKWLQHDSEPRNIIRTPPPPKKKIQQRYRLVRIFAPLMPNVALYGVRDSLGIVYISAPLLTPRLVWMQPPLSP